MRISWTKPGFAFEGPSGIQSPDSTKVTLKLSIKLSSTLLRGAIQKSTCDNGGQLISIFCNLSSYDKTT